MTAHPVVGLLVPYLGGQFGAFSTSDVHGLAWVRGDRIDFLALVAEQPGRGDVGRFLAACQVAYRMVGIWEIWSPRLRGMLERRGFRAARDVLEGEVSDGMVWRVAQAASSPCGRCGVGVVDGEVCWWCHGPLCSACWEAIGRCGHPEAEAENERARRVPQPAGHPHHGRIPA